MSDPNNLQAMDDLKNLLGIRNVNPVLAPPKQIETLLAKAYSGEIPEFTGVSDPYEPPAAPELTLRTNEEE